MSVSAETSIVGTFFDWPNRSIKPSGYQLATTRVFDRAMPTNRNNIRKNGKYVSGGAWFKWEAECKTTGSSVTTYRPNYGKAYTGMYTYRNRVSDCSPNNFGFGVILPTNPQTELDKLELLGAEAWNLLRPDSPDFTLGSSLYELREVPSMLKQATSDLLRKVRAEQARRGGKRWYSYAGEWYLAINFGWLPLYSDIKNFSEAFNDKHKRLDQLIRDEGRPIRRKREMKDHSDSTDSSTSTNYASSPISNVFPVHVTQCYGSGSSIRTTMQSEVRTWCVGQFRYILPPGPRTDGWKRNMYRRIMGGSITPSQLYNIMPWSWLIDYFTDLGQFMEAISPGVADNLVADYAYLMRHTTYLNRLDITQTTVSGMKATQQQKVHVNWERTMDIKSRVTASPFGFGVKQTDLSVKQLAILGALGLSRLP